LGDIGQRFINKQQAGLEAQLANLADEIAYNNHDIDDGLRAGLIDMQQLQSVSLFREQYGIVKTAYPDLPERRIVHEVVRRMINRQVVDLVETSQAQLAGAQLADSDAARSLPQPLIGFSPAMHAQNLELKQFLRKNLYQHYRVRRMTSKAARVINGLFEAFMSDPYLLPPESLRNVQAVEQSRGERSEGPKGRARAVADYIAGMTDRFAIKEYDRLFNPFQLT